MTEQTIIFVVIGSVAAMLILGGGIIGATMVIRPKVLLRQRMNQIGVIGDGAPSEKKESRRQRRIQEKVKQLESKGEKQGGLEAVRDELLQAGLDITIGSYFVICAVAGVLSAFVYLVLGFHIFGALPVAVVGSLFLPRFVLRFIAKRRQKMFTAKFADAIDLIVRGIRSGLPVNECLSVVAREFDPPVGEEFRLLVEGMNLGLPMDDLMAKGLKRIPTPEYKFFAIVTQIQKQTGGNLADTLSNLSGVLRERKKMRDKAQAMASEAKSSAGIIGSLPFVVSGLLSVVNPDYLLLLFTTDAGNYMIYGGLFWMFCGSMVMRNMINFEM